MTDATGVGVFQRVEELEAENERLRKALLKAITIAEEHEGKFSVVGAMRKHVRKALGDSK